MSVHEDAAENCEELHAAAVQESKEVVKDRRFAQTGPVRG